ncbi:MAG: HAD family hydrolase [Eubacteriales bacterium]|nr:HAD family hydrolase [Eubacteriales bacterium]
MARNNHIKAVCFDMDNTLYSYDEAHAAANRSLLDYGNSRFGKSDEEFLADIARAQELLVERVGFYNASSHNRILRFQCLMELLGEDVGGALEMYHAYWDVFLENLHPEPGIYELLDGLKKAGVRIGLGTNMMAYMQYEKMKRLQMSKYFDRIMSSEEACTEKPKPEFYQFCVKKLECEPSECIFIGDSRKNDAEGASNAGLYGLWYSRYEKKASDISDLPEIRDYRECLTEQGIQLGIHLI